MPIPREPASPSKRSSFILPSSSVHPSFTLLPEVKTFSTMSQLMQTLQDTQTVCQDMEGGGKEELVSLGDMDMNMGRVGRGNEDADEGFVEMVHPYDYSSPRVRSDQGQVGVQGQGWQEDHPLFSLQALGY